MLCSRWCLGSIEDANIALSAPDIEQNGTLNIDEETHDNKDASNPGNETCIMSLDREWKSLIVEYARSCKNC